MFAGISNDGSARGLRFGYQHELPESSFRVLHLKFHVIHFANRERFDGKKTAGRPHVYRWHIGTPFYTLTFIILDSVACIAR